MSCQRVSPTCLLVVLHVCCSLLSSPACLPRWAEKAATASAPSSQLLSLCFSFTNWEERECNDLKWPTDFHSGKPKKTWVMPDIKTSLYLNSKDIFFSFYKINQKSEMHKFTFLESHIWQNSHIQSLIFLKIHIFRILFSTKFTFLESHFGQNSYFQNHSFHKIHTYF